jgi:hypothetical protein
VVFLPHFASVKPLIKLEFTRRNEALHSKKPSRAAGLFGVEKLISLRGNRLR